MNLYFEMLLSVFQFSIAIRNVWPQKMSWKAYVALYALLLVAALPVTLLPYMRYGLFTILIAVCVYGLLSHRDTQPQNICMGLVGCALAIVIDDLLIDGLTALLPAATLESPWLSFCITFGQMVLFYFITLLCGRLIKKALLPRKGIFQIPQAWYLIDATLLLFAIVFMFNNVIRGKADSAASTVYYNLLLALGYVLVVLLLFLSMFRAYRERTQAEIKQKSFQALQDYTSNLESMYSSLRSFKHDYINILVSISGYIENEDMTALKTYFEDKILPTKNLINQGDYKLNQLSNIGVVEIKSLLSAKIIYAHEMGIDVTIDIPDAVKSFNMDTVDLARILGIFLDNAIEAALETEHPKVGLNIIQNSNSVAVIVSNSFQGNDLALHQMKKNGFSTKAGHQGIGLSNAQAIISTYDNVLLETTKQDSYFTQYMEIAAGKE